MGSLGNNETGNEKGNMEISPPRTLKTPLTVPEKLLMGPGPSNCYPKRRQACALPMMGHCLPEFFIVSLIGTVSHYTNTQKLHASQ